MPSSTSRESPSLILASGSPRRREILDRFAVSYVVRPANVDESVRPEEAPESYVLRLARTKASARVDPDEIVLAADTTVTLDGRILGKPEDPADAADMLRFLSGRTHEVLTGVALALGISGEVDGLVASTAVHFAELDERTIAWYVGTGEGVDKAGGYAVQGQASLFVDRLEGSWDNVVGLPISAVEQLLRDRGYSLLDWR